ncbi:type IV secretion protein Rhs [Atlantibacter sp.]|uniref:type IV secretion protein Rhs n=1 Tax=Atlantibacter sp. TaxID=1903473 RepID=UPI0028ADCAF5|nr:type IV secretion protein Rhs [Atlantibacter sp.]
MSIDDVSKKKKNDKKRSDDSVRELTTGEIALARTVFGSRIDYEKVKIHHDSYLPFGLQDERTAMTPNGEIYFRYWYRDDFSKSLPFLRHLFIHEMSHVWQRERGMNVIGRGLVSWMVSYRYTLDGRLLSEYPMEQQAQIIADNFTLQTEDYYGWLKLRIDHSITLDGDISESNIRQKYKYALRGFPW